MKPSDFQRFHAVMTGLAEMHQRELSTFLLDAYWLALRDWTLEEFEQAASHLMQTMGWMPKPSDFTKLRSAGELTAGEAWDVVLSGQALEPGSRLERAARIVGGQYAIRHANVEKDLPFIQRRFMDAYGELSDVDAVREKLPQIAAPDLRAALRKPEPLAGIASRIERQQRATNATAPAQLPAPKTKTAEPTITISAREKVAKLIGLNLADEDIAKVSGQSIEVVFEVRASLAKEVAA